MIYKYRSDIDGLRAIAILSVFVYHAFPNIIPGGFIGVDIFFVISGYLISLGIFDGIDRKNFSFADFYVRRTRRIFPALLIVLIATYVAGLFVLLPDELTRLGKNIAAAATFTLNFVLKQNTGYFDAAGEQNPVLHLWSLCIEEQFYILFPIVFLLIAKINLNRVVSILIIIIASFYLNASMVTENAAAAFYLPITRFWEMAIGSLLAAISVRQQFLRLEKIGSLLSVTGFALIFLGVFLIDKSMEFPGWVALVPSLGAMFILSVSKKNKYNKFLSNPIMVWVGKISYPLYLWHYPVFAYLRVYEGAETNAGQKISAMALAVILAWLTYKFIEYPIRFGIGRKVSNKVVISILVGLLIAIAVLGKKTQSARGFQGRINGQLIENAKQSDRIPDGIACSTPIFESAELNCLIADPNRPPTHALIGDSHASHFYAGMVEHVNETGGNLILLSGPGCVPFIGIRTRNAKGDPQTCGPIVDEIHSFLDKTPTIKTVVLATRGPITLTGKPFGEEDVIGRYIDSDDYPSAKTLHDLFSQSLDATLAHLRMTGKKVVIILDNPELGFNPTLCNDLPLIRKTKQTCTIARSEVEERNREYRNLIGKLTLIYPEVEIVDSFKAFCDADNCYAKKDGEWLYRDNNHLTNSGSRQLKPLYAF